VVVQGGVLGPGEVQMEVELLGVLSGEAKADVEVLAWLTFEVQGIVESMNIAAIFTVEALSLNDFQMRKGILSLVGS